MKLITKKETSMSTNKKQWEKPELIIIDRCYKEESVLLGCYAPGTACTVPEKDGSVN